jgi:hypothetical protein
MNTFIASIIRHILTTVGGGLITGGVIDDSQVTIIAGAVASVIGVVWSVIEKKYLIGK